MRRIVVVVFILLVLVTLPQAKVLSQSCTYEQIRYSCYRHSSPTPELNLGYTQGFVQCYFRKPPPPSTAGGCLPCFDDLKLIIQYCNQQVTRCEGKCDYACGSGTVWRPYFCIDNTGQVFGPFNVAH